MVSFTRSVSVLIVILVIGGGIGSYFVLSSYYFRPGRTTTLTCISETVVTGDTSFGAMAYDSTNGRIYIGVGNNLTVVNAFSNSVMTSENMGFQVTSVGYDPANHLVYLGSSADFQNAVLDPTTGKLTSLSYNATPTLPSQDSSFIPKMGVFYTPFLWLFEVNASSDKLVTYLNFTQGIVDTAYDNVTGLVYLADSSGDSVLALTPGSNEIVQNISLGYRAGPSSLVVDPTNGYLYVSDYGNRPNSTGYFTYEMGNVTVINTKTNEIVKIFHGVGPYPNFFVYAQSTHDVYFALDGNGHIVNQRAYRTPAQVLGIDYKTNSIVYNATLSANATTINIPSGMIYDPENSCLYVAGQKEVMTIPTVSQ